MTETPDLPCPKCGSKRTEMKYCDAVSAWRAEMAEREQLGPMLGGQLFPSKIGPWYRDTMGQERPCVGPGHGHFHRGCLRCEYRWITEDVVTGT